MAVQIGTLNIDNTTNHDTRIALKFTRNKTQHSYAKLMESNNL